uniref:Pseudouridine-5'-monophosphatase n=1 Tax=Lygus hesperus TaxID=30085 RepID=A0A0K8TES3_LYGHE
MLREAFRVGRQPMLNVVFRRRYASDDIYIDKEDACKAKLPPKKKIGNMIIEDKPYECNVDKREEKSKIANCWDGRKALTEKKHTSASHVIFNLDGVVLDSERLIHEAHTMYLAKFKKGFPNKLKIQTSGLSELDAAKLLIYELNLKEALPGITDAVYAQGVRQFLRGMFPRIKLVEGVNDLICHLYTNNVPIALASSNTEALFKQKTRCFTKLMDRFCHIVLRTDPEVKRGKPDPDMLHVTMNKFTKGPADRSKYLAIEDSIAGARAARAAGMQVVLLPSRPIPRDMAEKEADLVVDRLADIDLADFNLPPLPPDVHFT